ncbi:MAG: hypothetical protein M1298_01375 [Chloroflexi bacterium]|nr:hypothetical protein [Chloroflexota bacterium]
MTTSKTRENLDHVLQVLVESSQRRVSQLQSWGFGPDHPEVSSARIMFEMQQYVLKVHRQAQRLLTERHTFRDR